MEKELINKIVTKHLVGDISTEVLNTMDSDFDFEEFVEKVCLRVRSIVSRKSRRKDIDKEQMLSLSDRQVKEIISINSAEFVVLDDML